VQGIGCMAWVHGVGCRAVGAGRWVQGSGCRALGAEQWMQGTRFNIARLSLHGLGGLDAHLLASHTLHVHLACARCMCTLHVHRAVTRWVLKYKPSLDQILTKCKS